MGDWFPLTAWKKSTFQVGLKGMEQGEMMDMGAPQLFNAQFNGIIAHHRGAIVPAEIALQIGTQEEIRMLAETIITDQNVESGLSFHNRACVQELPALPHQVSPL